MAQGSGEPVKVLGSYPSPFVLRVRIALHMKSINYEFIQETFQPRSELLLKSNPVHKKIPVFFHHDKPICESLVVVQYIDEVWSSGPSILPSDPYDRAIQRFWSAYIDDKWFCNLLKAAVTEREKNKFEALQKVKEGLALLEDYFGKKCSKFGKPFFNGDNIGYFDIAFGGFLGWLKATEIKTNVRLLDETKTPALFAWASKFCAHDAVKDVMPDPFKLVEFTKILVKLDLDMLTNIRDD